MAKTTLEGCDKAALPDLRDPVQRFEEDLGVWAQRVFADARCEAEATGRELDRISHEKALAEAKRRDPSTRFLRAGSHECKAEVERLRASNLHYLQHQSDLRLQANRDGFHFGSRIEPGVVSEAFQEKLACMGVELPSPRVPDSFRVRAFHIAIFFLFGFALGFGTLRFLLQ